MSISSLSRFADTHRIPGRIRFPYNSTTLADWTRWWGLAQCGHHPCCDGRPAQHRGDRNSMCICGLGACTLAHTLADCPCTDALRQVWANRVGLGTASPRTISAAAVSNWIFDPADPANTDTSVAAHICFVGRACLMVHSRGIHRQAPAATFQV